jgi:vesicle coat complex subunit
MYSPYKLFNITFRGNTFSAFSLFCNLPPIQLNMKLQILLLHLRHIPLLLKVCVSSSVVRKSTINIIAAASCHIELVLKESDNNIKLIVLDRLIELREKHDKVLDDLVMDVLRVLSRYAISFELDFDLIYYFIFISPDIDVRKKALDIALELTSSRNVVEVVGFLKKELLKTLDQEYEKVSWCLHNFPFVLILIYNIE